MSSSKKIPLTNQSLRRKTQATLLPKKKDRLNMFNSESKKEDDDFNSTFSKMSLRDSPSLSPLSTPNRSIASKQSPSLSPFPPLNKSTASKQSPPFSPPNRSIASKQSPSLSLFSPSNKSAASPSSLEKESKKAIIPKNPLQTSVQIEQDNEVKGTALIERDETNGLKKIELSLNGLFLDRNNRESTKNYAEGIITKPKEHNSSSDAAHLFPDVFGVKNTKGIFTACATSSGYNKSEMADIEDEVIKIVKEKKIQKFAGKAIVEFEPMDTPEAFAQIMCSVSPAISRRINRRPDQIDKRLKHVQAREPLARRVKSFKVTYQLGKDEKIYTLGRDVRFEIPDRYYTHDSTSTGKYRFAREVPAEESDYDSDFESLEEYNFETGIHSSTKDKLKALDKSRDELSEILGCSPSHATNLLNGNRPLSKKYMGKLTASLNLNEDLTPKKSLS